MLLCARSFTLQISQNHGLLNLTSTSFAQSSASARFANAPAATQATIVLPAFARSCSADKGGIRKNVFTPLCGVAGGRVIQRSVDRLSPFTAVMNNYKTAACRCRLL